MAASRWEERFFGSTRGQVVLQLRRSNRTVEELAHALGLTDNAIRAHLASLERDGLVRQQGTRRGAGKPAFDYGLTPEAERLFEKAYAPVLHAVLNVLAERLPPSALDDVLREAGRWLASGQPASTGDLRQRAEQAVRLLNDLGGAAELREHDGTLEIQGFGCPLAAIVPGHPRVCKLAESLLSEVVGAPVQESCARDELPRCHFTIGHFTIVG